MRKVEVVMPLPAGFSVRRSTCDDMEQLTELERASEIAQIGEPDTTIDDMRSHLETIDLGQDTWVLEVLEAPGATEVANNPVVAHAYVDSNRVGKFTGHVTVRPGYAATYLVPNKICVYNTPGIRERLYPNINLEQLEKKRQVYLDMKKFQSKIEKVSIEL